jgi:hypothetical protein
MNAHWPCTTAVVTHTASTWLARLSADVIVDGPVMVSFAMTLMSALLGSIIVTYVLAAPIRLDLLRAYALQVGLVMALLVPIKMSAS